MPKLSAPKTYYRLKKIMLSCMLFFSANLLAQDAIDSSCRVMDAKDFIQKWFHRPPKSKPSGSSFLITPVIGSTPSTGFLVGLALQGAAQFPGSNMSAFQAGIQYTAKKQLMLSFKNTVFLENNKVLLAGDWRYFDYMESTYGLGTNAPGKKLPRFFVSEGAGEPDSLVQPMFYDYFKIHQTISFKIKNHLYIGPGIHIDLYRNIFDKKLSTSLGSVNLTSHYAYSTFHQFNRDGYSVIGTSLNIVYDTRDNMLNAYKGIYANINYRVNPTFLGSDENSSVLWTEFRGFQGVSKRVPQKVLAFWFVGNFTVSGKLPYLNLPGLGYDQRSKTGRGYTIGRFKGQQMVYAETEYRFPISKCKRTIGGVVFLNAISTTNSDLNIKLLEYVRIGYGAGIRILFDKKSRMNVQADYARGRDSHGVYFGASEVF